MPTTVSQVITRAANFSSGNQGLEAVTQNTALCATRVYAEEVTLFARAARLSYDYFGVRGSVAVANDAADLSTLSPPVVKLLAVALPDGTPVAWTDVLGAQGRLAAPRAVLRGRVLSEVGSEWGAATTLSVEYARGPAPYDLTAAGLASVNVSMPDEWVDLLVLRLAMFFSRYDVGRDAAERAELQALYDAQLEAFDTVVQGLAGPVAGTLLQPAQSPARR